MKAARAPLVLLAWVLSACGTVAPTIEPTFGQFGDSAVLGISNGTELEVTLFVNGAAVGTAMPGVGLEPIEFEDLPSLPWTVEARSQSGRVLTSMEVKADSVTGTTNQNGNTETGGVFGRVDLSCGRLTIWAGYHQPSGPAPVETPGSPGDCEP